MTITINMLLSHASTLLKKFPPRKEKGSEKTDHDELGVIRSILNDMSEAISPDASLNKQQIFALLGTLANMRLAPSGDLIKLLLDREFSNTRALLQRKGIAAGTLKLEYNRNRVSLIVKKVTENDLLALPYLEIQDLLFICLEDIQDRIPGFSSKDLDADNPNLRLYFLLLAQFAFMYRQKGLTLETDKTVCESIKKEAFAPNAASLTLAKYIFQLQYDILMQQDISSVDMHRLFDEIRLHPLYQYLLLSSFSKSQIDDLMEEGRLTHPFHLLLRESMGLLDVDDQIKMTNILRLLQDPNQTNLFTFAIFLDLRDEDKSPSERMQLADYYYELYELDLLQNPYCEAILWNRIHHGIEPCAAVDLVRDLARYSDSLCFDRIPTRDLALFLRSSNALNLCSPLFLENKHCRKFLSNFLWGLSQHIPSNQWHVFLEDPDLIAMLQFYQNPRELDWVKDRNLLVIDESLSGNSTAYPTSFQSKIGEHYLRVLKFDFSSNLLIYLAEMGGISTSSKKAILSRLLESPPIHRLFQSVFLKENEALHALIGKKILFPIITMLAGNPAVNEGDPAVAVLSRLLQWVKGLSNDALSYFLPKLLIKDNVEEMSIYLEKMMQQHVEMLEQSEFTTIVEAYYAYNECILAEEISDNAGARVMGIVYQETDFRFFTSPAARQRLSLRNIDPR